MSLLRAVVYGRSWRTLDANRREVPLFDHLAHAGDADPPIDKATFDAVRRDANSLRAGNWDSGPKWGMVILFVWLAVAATVKLYQQPTLGNVLGLLLWAGLIAFIVWAWQKLINASPRQFVRCMLAHRHCPACGYTLHRSSNPRTTCSECGASWESAEIPPAMRAAAAPAHS